MWPSTGALGVGLLLQTASMIVFDDYLSCSSVLQPCSHVGLVLLQLELCCGHPAWARIENDCTNPQHASKLLEPG
jgi:hypothetical protein